MIVAAPLRRQSPTLLGVKCEILRLFDNVAVKAPTSLSVFIYLTSALYLRLNRFSMHTKGPK
jgi:hypothetical protein